jgi:hypothetical protein
MGHRPYQPDVSSIYGEERTQRKVDSRNSVAALRMATTRTGTAQHHAQRQSRADPRLDESSFEASNAF